VFSNSVLSQVRQNNTIPGLLSSSQICTEARHKLAQARILSFSGVRLSWRGNPISACGPQSTDQMQWTCCEEPWWFMLSRICYKRLLHMKLPLKPTKYNLELARWSHGFALRLAEIAPYFFGFTRLCPKLVRYSPAKLSLPLPASNHLHVARRSPQCVQRWARPLLQSRKSARN